MILNTESDKVKVLNIMQEQDNNLARDSHITYNLLTQKQRSDHRALVQQMEKRRQDGGADIVICGGRIIKRKPFRVQRASEATKEEARTTHAQHIHRSPHAQHATHAQHPACLRTDTVKSHFTVLYTNAESIMNKRPELKAHMARLNPQVIAITEVKQKNTRYVIERCELHIEGY